MILYAIKDNKSGKFDRPFPMINDQVAIRGFKTIVNDKNTEPGKYPEDFELYKVGEMSEDTGVVVSDVVFLVVGSNLVGGIKDGNV